MAKLTPADFANVLRIPATCASDPARLLANVQSRLVGIGLKNVCPRCNGGGSYSFNLKDGTVCYGCSGLGYVARPLTKALLAEVESAVSAGILDEHLNYLRRVQWVRRNDPARSAQILYVESCLRPGPHLHLAGEYRMGFLPAAAPFQLRASVERKMQVLVEEIDQLQRKIVYIKGAVRPEWVADLVTALEAFPAKLVALAQERDAITPPTAGELQVSLDSRRSVMGEIAYKQTCLEIDRLRRTEV